MARFPKIQRMCPYKDSVAEFMDGDTCRICSRQVHQLSEMTEAQRSDFLSNCSEEVCVSYALPIRTKTAAVALSAAMMALPVAAQQPAPDIHHNHSKFENGFEGVDEQELSVIVVGGIKDFSNIEYLDEAEDLEIPELPVTVEESKDPAEPEQD